eukprot:scaffold2093_cov161-Amphora_coffeaeformis.AAC.16
MEKGPSTRGLHDTTCCSSRFLQLPRKPKKRGLSSLEHSVGKRGRRIGIASRIIRSLADSKVLDFSIDDVHSETLATSNNTHTGRAGVSHLQVNRLGKFGGRVAHHGDDALDALVFTPGLHDSRVVHAVNYYGIDSRGLEVVCDKKWKAS